MSSPVADTNTVAEIRRQFPILNRPLPNGKPFIYLDNAASAQKPACVIDAESDVYRSYYANAHRGDYYYGLQIDEKLEGTRAAVAERIGAAAAEEIIFTAGTTMSINLVARAWGGRFLQPGDEILLSELEHHANIVPWQIIAQEKGAVVRYLPLTDDYRIDVSRLSEFLTERTRLVAVAGMSNVLGTIAPLEEITAKAKECGALVLVDGAQSFPHCPVNVQQPTVDFFAFSGHKAYGPTGVGVLYGRRELLEEMNPFLGGGHMIDRVGREKSEWAPPPAKFEAGTLPIAQAIALGTAVEWMTHLGLDVIRQHEDRLLRYALTALQDVPGLTIYGPAAEHKGAIVSFTMQGAHAQDLAFLLNRHGIAVRYGHHCTMPLHEKLGVSATVRASFAVYNTEDEIDQLVAALHSARKRLRLD